MNLDRGTLGYWHTGVWMPMKKQKARETGPPLSCGRSIAWSVGHCGTGHGGGSRRACPKPLGWLGGLGGIQTAMAAQRPGGGRALCPSGQRLLLGDSALAGPVGRGIAAGQAQAGRKYGGDRPGGGGGRAECCRRVDPEQESRKNHLRQRRWLCQCPGHLLFNRTREDGGSGGGGQGRVFPLLSKGGGRLPSPDYAHPWIRNPMPGTAPSPTPRDGVARTTDTSYNIIRVGER